MLTNAVERAAAALGVWLGDGRVENFDIDASSPWLGRREDGGYSFGYGEAVWHERANGQRSTTGRPIARCDETTAALLLLGHTRGLRVDLGGECPACRERGSKRGLARWEWTFITGNRHHLPALRARVQGWETSKLHDCVVASRPCPACTVDGKPTGRESIDWSDAIARAMPGPPCCASTDCGCYGMGEPGDPDTREAIGVLADQMQTSTDPDWGRTHALGLWLATWLSGASCPACGGDGRHYPTSPEGVRTSPLPHPSRECGRCHGHGSALGIHAPEIAAELERLTDESKAP